MKIGFENATPKILPKDVEVGELLQKPISSDAQQEETDLVYQKNKLVFRNKDLSTYIRENMKSNPQVFSEIAKELEKFRRKIEKESHKKAFLKTLTPTDEEELSHVLALCEAHLSRLAELLQNRYSHLTSGMEIEFDEHGQLILNGINVQMALESYRHSKHPKARLYLQGLARRLYSVLGETHKNRLYARLQDTVWALYQEIMSELTAV